MGVLACDRHGCTNIMCDMLVNNKYVCNDCAAEFSSEYPFRLYSLDQMQVAFDIFMNCPVTPKLALPNGINGADYLEKCNENKSSDWQSAGRH